MLNELPVLSARCPRDLTAIAEAGHSLVYGVRAEVGLALGGHAHQKSGTRG